MDADARTAFLKRIDDIATQLADRAATAERQRRPDDASIQELEDSGLFGLLVPRRHGGMEGDLDLLLDTIPLLATGCPSTAWVASFYVAHSWMASLFPEAARQEFFADRPWVRTPAVFAPSGSAVPQGDGYRLSGRWRWATGVMHADWILVAALIASDDAKPQARLFAVPAAEAGVNDIWFVDGMAATGSNEIVIEDTFVPAYRSIDFLAFRDGTTPGALELGNDLYRLPMPPFLALVAALPALGIAQATLTRLRAEMQSRFLPYENKPQHDKVGAQMRLGRAAADIRSSELLLTDLSQRLSRSQHSGIALSTAERAELRMLAATAVHTCQSVVRSLVEAAGSSAHFVDNPLQRLLRDINVLATHIIFDWDATSEMFGRVQLGLKPGSMLV